MNEPLSRSPEDRAPALAEPLLRALPKTDLHCHLDGSLRLATILELASEQGVALPASDEAGLARAIHMGETCGSLDEYLVAFDVTLSVLQTEDALFRAAYELGVDCAADGVRYVEVRYSPVLNQRRGLALPAVVEAVVAGLARAERETGIRGSTILCGIRSMAPAVSLEIARVAAAYRDRGVCGFDLAGGEAAFPAADHAAAFLHARQAELSCTCHAGEAAGPGSVAQAIHLCGAHRIGHGVRLGEDPRLLAYANDHRIALECCPSSNVQTGAVASLEAHPLRRYLRQGLRVTVNTDNRLITDTTATKELLLAHTRCGLDAGEIAACVINGWKSAFLPYEEKRERIRTAEKEIDRLFAEAGVRVA